MEALVNGDTAPRRPRVGKRPAGAEPRPRPARPAWPAPDPAGVTHKDSAKLSSSMASIVGAPQSPARACGPAPASYRARRRARLRSGPRRLNRIKAPQEAAPAPRSAIARGQG